MSQQSPRDPCPGPDCTARYSQRAARRLSACPECGTIIHPCPACSTVIDVIDALDHWDCPECGTRRATLYELADEDPEKVTVS